MYENDVPLVSFDTIFNEVLYQITAEGKKLTKIYTSDKYNLSRYLKNQDGLSFKKGTSSFLDEKRDIIKIKLKEQIERKFIIPEEEIIFFDNEPPEDFPTYFNDLLSKGFIETCPISDGILFISKVEVYLFGQEKYWILLFTAKEQEIDLDEEGNFASGFYKECYEWLKKPFLECKEFSNEDQLNQKIGFFVGPRDMIEFYLFKFNDPSIFLTSKSFENELEEIFKDKLVLS